MLLLVATFSFVANAKSFFFGGVGNNACGCQLHCPIYPPCPIVTSICSPAPVYSPVPAVAYPLYSPYSHGGNYQDCCATCATPCFSKRVKQVIKNKFRLKRNTAAEYKAVEEELLAVKKASIPTSSIDTKCNNERLRQIIIMNGSLDVSVAKRNIQLTAEKQFQAKYNIICSNKGDFSYITITDEYCQDVINADARMQSRVTTDFKTNRYRKKRKIRE